MDKKKYEDMLMKLAEEFPELEQGAMDLHSAMMDLDAPDVAEGEKEGEEEMGPEIEISIEDPAAEGEEEDMPMPMKKGKKMPIPAELMDEEEDK